MTINILPEFPTVFDSTIRSAFANCMVSGYWGHIRHLRKPGGNIHLHFGGALALGFEVARKSYYGVKDPIEYYVRGEKHTLPHCNNPADAVTNAMIAATEHWNGDEGDSLVPMKGPSVNKTYNALIDAIDCYFIKWPLDIDDLQPYRLPNGDPFVEKTFAFPIEGTEHPITGKRIVYAGRLDMLGVWKDTDLRMVVDEKHSTQLGDNWEKSWIMRSQISGYCYATGLFEVPVKNALIRGIGILKGDITFAESYQSREQWHIDKWLIQMRRDVNRAAATWKLMRDDFERNGPNARLHEHWDQNLDTMCSSYGGCPFIDLCTSANPERWVNAYDEVIWNPLSDRG